MKSFESHKIYWVDQPIKTSAIPRQVGIDSKCSITVTDIIENQCNFFTWKGIIASEIGENVHLKSEETILITKNVGIKCNIFGRSGIKILGNVQSQVMLESSKGRIEIESDVGSYTKIIAEEGVSVLGSLGHNVEIHARRGDVIIKGNIGSDSSITYCGQLIIEGEVGKNVKVNGVLFYRPLIVEEKKQNDIVSQLNNLIVSKVHTLDEEGNNCLHLLVLHSSPEHLNSIIKLIGKTVAVSLASQTNNKGKSPLQLAHEILNIQKKINFLNLLLPITLGLKIKKMHEPLDSVEIISLYPQVKINSELEEIIRIACDVVNQARMNVLLSSTHPDMNLASDDTKEHAVNSVLKLRNFLSKKNNNLNTISKSIRSIGAANCMEFSYLVFSDFLDMLKYKSLTVEIVTISNGDHAFVVINRDKESDINTPETWGQCAIVVDAWLGKVFPANSATFESELKNFKSYTYDNSIILNFLFSFNRNYHKLKSEYSANSGDCARANYFIKFS